MFLSLLLIMQVDVSSSTNVINYLATSKSIVEVISEHNPNAKLKDFKDFPENLVKISQCSEIPVSAIIAQIIKESNFDPNEVSPKGAIGLLQVTAPTAVEVGKLLGYSWTEQDMVLRLKEPVFNVSVGITYLLTLEQKFDSRVMAYKGFLAGPAAAHKIPKNGSKYIDGIMKTKKILEENYVFLSNAGSIVFSVSLELPQNKDLAGVIIDSTSDLAGTVINSTE